MHTPPDAVVRNDISPKYLLGYWEIIIYAFHEHMPEYHSISWNRNKNTPSFCSNMRMARNVHLIEN